MVFAWGFSYRKNRYNAKLGKAYYFSHSIIHCTPLYIVHKISLFENHNIDCTIGTWSQADNRC